jgi:transposase InsO family protein
VAVARGGDGIGVGRQRCRRRWRGGWLCVVGRSFAGTRRSARRLGQTRVGARAPGEDAVVSDEVDVGGRNERGEPAEEFSGLEDETIGARGIGRPGPSQAVDDAAVVAQGQACGKLYLAAVLDLFSRYVVGWAVRRLTIGISRLRHWRWP